MPGTDRPSRAVGRLAAIGLLVATFAVVSCGRGDGSVGGAATDDGAGHKVTVAGDSISVGLGAELRDVVALDPVGSGVTVKVIGVPGTGLARPDSFDWPQRMRELARDFPPEVVVFSVGSNDAQDLTDADGNTVVTFSDEDAWDDEYSKRLAEVFDAFAPVDGDEPGTRVVWVGHVRTESDVVADTNRRVHRLATEVAADRPWVDVRDLDDLLDLGDETADRCLQEDGLHLTVDCMTEAAEALLPDLLPR